MPRLKSLEQTQENEILPRLKSLEQTQENEQSSTVQEDENGNRVILSKSNREKAEQESQEQQDEESSPRLGE